MSIRTVLGDINANELGATDYHEHLFQVSPLLIGDELISEELSAREAALLVAAGIDAIVDATPIGLGRNPLGLARISAMTGMKIVATTGCHRSAHYSGNEQFLNLNVEELSATFLRDINKGMPKSDNSLEQIDVRDHRQPIRAGLLKVGIDYWKIDSFARRVIEAIGRVHEKTSAPVMVHLEHGSASFEVLELLNTVGVGPNAVVLAHVDRNLDYGLHAELATTGAYLGYDGMARHREHSDLAILECLSRTVEGGGGSRIMIGGDVARSSRFLAYGGMPGMSYLPDRFIPRMVSLLGQSITTRILKNNPQTFLNRF